MRKTLAEILEYARKRRWKIRLTRRMVERRKRLLEGADLRSMDLHDADLRGARLRGARLRGANLTSAYLSSADLSSADLTGANLTGANLGRADLTGANLRDTNLFNANLFNANLFNANLTGADLSSAYLPEGFHILTIGPIGSRRDCVEFRNDHGIVTVSTGCFKGTVDEFIAAVERKDPGVYKNEYKIIIIPALRAWLAQFEGIPQ